MANEIEDSRDAFDIKKKSTSKLLIFIVVLLGCATIGLMASTIYLAIDNKNDETTAETTTGTNTTEISTSETDVTGSTEETNTTTSSSTETDTTTEDVTTTKRTFRPPFYNEIGHYNE
ncbi:hypothetical protein CHUAL_007018 [Chamberlinius hualienensis]